MSFEALKYLAHAQTALSAIVALLALSSYRTRSTEVKLIGLMFLLGFVTNLSAYILHEAGLSGYVNFPQNLYFVGNLCLLSAFYYVVLGRRDKFVFVSVVVVYLIFSVANLFFLQKARFNSFSGMLSSSCAIVFALIFFYRLMRDTPTVHLTHHHSFWFNTAFLFYHAGTFFLFVFTDYLTRVLRNDLIAYWSFHNFLSIIEHFIVVVGVWFEWQHRARSPA